MSRQNILEAKKPLLFWLIRRVEVCTPFLSHQYLSKHRPSIQTPTISSQVIRGKVPLRMECAPAFNYARTPHHLSIIPDDSIPNCGEGSVQTKALFYTDVLSLDLRFVAESNLQTTPTPAIQFERLDLRSQGHLAESAYCDFTLEEG